MPIRAWAVVALAGAGGVLTLGWAALDAVRHGGSDPLLAIIGCTILIVASWLRPLMLYRGSDSEAVHLDEGFLLVMALTLSPVGTIAAFAGATLLAQCVRRRPLVKSIFNSGQILVSVGAALVVQRAIAVPAGDLGPLELLAAVAGTITFFVVNSLALAAILAAMGTPARAAILDGLEIRLLLVGAAMSTALVAALAIAAQPWSWPLAVPPVIVLRQLLAGHFSARHDRARLLGLFDATLATHGSMSEHDVETALVTAAGDLLRAPKTHLADGPGDEGAIAVPLTSAGSGRWLVAAGRSRLEPYDDADRHLLDALAAVGSAALTNAYIHQKSMRDRERLATITATIGEGVCAIDRNGVLTFANPAARALLGWDDDVDPQDMPAFLLAPSQLAIASGRTMRNDEAVFERADGTSFPVSTTVAPVVVDGVTTAAVLTFRDTTERRAFEDELARQAFQDALTGLANRRLFLGHLDHALLRSRRSGESHVVLFADVDRFKLVNDNLGHASGDQLLVAIAERIGKALRSSDILSRFGGDEFTALLEDTPRDEALAIVQRIHDALSVPIVLDEGHEVSASVSIGLAMTTPASTGDDVLHDADVAMYEAKARGGGQHAVFERGAMAGRSSGRLDLEAELRRAVQSRDFVVHYQPLVDLVDGRPIGAEALIRWQHPIRGILSPSEFIAVTEESGLILDIGRFVIEEALTAAKRWRTSVGRPISVSVNLSTLQFRQPDLVSGLASLLDATGTDPDQLCLEITETLAIQDMEASRGTVRALRDLGVRIAIDDFGTGYSSLQYLKRLPVQEVKIDRSFVAGVAGDPVDAAIVKTVVHLAQAIGLAVVAEGVETEEQRQCLLGLGCRVGQGYLFARPAPEAEFLARLKESRAPAFLR